jgi:hypothetical protein
MNEKRVTEVLALALDDWACMDEDLVKGWLDVGGQAVYLTQALLDAGFLTADTRAWDEGVIYALAQPDRETLRHAHVRDFNPYRRER